MSLVKKRPGARPGQYSGQKRKAEHELSSNPLTKKVRERINAMTPVEKRIEDAKVADRAAVRRAITKLKKKAEWLNANPEERSHLEETTRQQTMDSR